MPVRIGWKSVPPDFSGFMGEPLAHERLLERAPKAIARRRGLGLFLALALTLMAASAQAAEFSAQVVTRTQMGEARGKIYVKGARIRNEMQWGGNRVGIFSPEEQVIWFLMPEARAYMEMPLGGEASRGFITLPKDPGRLKHLGTETVNGYLTDKYDSAMEMAGQTFRQTVWVARELKFPIKMQSADGSMYVEYRDIKEGPQPDGLFQVPEGYRKIGIPFPLGAPQPKAKRQK